MLDGSNSEDADSTPGTNDDIVLFDWFENFGLPSELFLGSGETLAVTVSLGMHVVTLRVTDRAGATATDDLVITVADTTQPSLTLDVSPALLWPPNHRMVDVTAVAVSGDLCGGVSVVLESISSSEPDDAPGTGDGSTQGDIQGAATGEADFAFQLRAERDTSGGGRVYTVTYLAADQSGNVRAASSEIVVPHDVAGLTEPLVITIDESSAGTVVSWSAVSGAHFYNVVRGDLGSVQEMNGAFDLGSVQCLAPAIAGPGTLGYEDDAVPASGQALLYLVEYDDGLLSGYGTESAPKPRLVPAGLDCP
jgi:hypothetical protein